METVTTSPKLRLGKQARQKISDVLPSSPWLVIEDFNEILSQNDKLGGPARQEREMKAFRYTLKFCNLCPVEFTGEWFTWQKKASGNENLKERLDWCMYNQGSQSSRFRFKSYRTNEPDCEDLIKKKWCISKEDPLQLVSQNFQQCSTSLEAWKKQKLGRLYSPIKHAKQKVQNLENSDNTTQRHFQEAFEAEKILGDLLLQEEMYWKHSDIKFHGCSTVIGVQSFSIIELLHDRNSIVLKCSTGDSNNWKSDFSSIFDIVPSHYSNVFQKYPVNDDALC